MTAKDFGSFIQKRTKGKIELQQLDVCKRFWFFIQKRTKEKICKNNASHRLVF